MSPVLTAAVQNMKKMAPLLWKPIPRFVHFLVFKLHPVW
jgi:hypothetical protein